MSRPRTSRASWIKSSAIQKMRSQVVAVRTDRRFGILAQAIHVTLADVPVGRIDRDVADAVAALLEQRSETVALLHRVALFQKGITEQRGAIVKGSDDLFIFQKVKGKVGISGFVVVVEPVRKGMVADEMAHL